MWKISEKRVLGILLAVSVFLNLAFVFYSVHVSVQETRDASVVGTYLLAPATYIILSKDGIYYQYSIDMDGSENVLAFGTYEAADRLHGWTLRSTYPSEKTNEAQIENGHLFLAEDSDIWEYLRCSDGPAYSNTVPSIEDLLIITGQIN